MSQEGNKDITIRLWPPAPAIWFGIAGAAACLDILRLLQSKSWLPTDPISLTTNPDPAAPPLELIELPIQLIVLLVKVVVFGLPWLVTLAMLIAVWRRWSNASIRRTNYWVWTGIEGSIAIVRLVLGFFQIFVFHTEGNYSFFSSLLWMVHSVAVPDKKLNAETEAVPSRE